MVQISEALGIRVNSSSEVDGSTELQPSRLINYSESITMIHSGSVLHCDLQLSRIVSSELILGEIGYSAVALTREFSRGFCGRVRLLGIMGRIR